MEVRTESLEDKGEDLGDSCAVKPQLVVPKDILVRHGHVIVDRGRIGRELEKHEGLYRTDIAVLNPLADHIREEFG